ncbi:hypothetical protein HYPSUDRAFT_198875 [Hypholoma sublateritium FD-334 SS-4]|uniref:Uncharacterized protein n=1 Tax=Hypholoma sublateritium (strain FD-334 SS-4) TaxID=945553 RepID=A0A0D2Q4V4_HYPSF|nr:hypothetical protein HYPSUDRAFT_198875 [Hypholoma sublateritium FD-334 SS-4]
MRLAPTPTGEADADECVSVLAASELGRLELLFLTLTVASTFADAALLRYATDALLDPAAASQQTSAEKVELAERTTGDAQAHVDDAVDPVAHAHERNYLLPFLRAPRWGLSTPSIRATSSL